MKVKTAMRPLDQEESTASVSISRVEHSRAENDIVAESAAFNEPFQSQNDVVSIQGVEIYVSKEEHSSANPSWSSSEALLFEKGVIEHGRCWDDVARVVGTRDRLQVEAFFLKEYANIEKPSVTTGSSNWTPSEALLFEHGRMKHGNDWEMIASLVGSRSGVEVETYFRRAKVPLRRGSPDDRVGFDTTEIEDSEGEHVEDSSNSHQRNRRDVESPVFPGGGKIHPSTDGDETETAEPNVDEQKEESHDSDEEKDEPTGWFPDVGERVFLSLPTDEGKISQRYFLTGRNFYCFKLSKFGGLQCICVHCGCVKLFNTVESFAKSIAHLSLHLIRVCPCSKELKEELEEASNMKSAVGVMNIPQFGKVVWNRKFPSRDIMSVADKTLAFAYKSKSPGRVRKIPSTPRKSTIAHAILESQVGEEGGIYSRPKRNATIAALANVKEDSEDRVDEDNKSEDDEHEDKKIPESVKANCGEEGGIYSRPKRTAAIIALANAKRDSEDRVDQDEKSEDDEHEDKKIHESVKVNCPIPGRVLPFSQMLEHMDDVHDVGLVPIVEDGHLPIATYFKIVTKYGKDELKCVCAQVGKDSRFVRIWKLVKRINDTVEKGYDLFLLLDALESSRRGRSVHSFVDDINEVFQEAEALVAAGNVPTGAVARPMGAAVAKPARTKLLVETDPSKQYVEETSFIFHDRKTSQECLYLPEESKDELEPLPDPGNFCFASYATELQSKLRFKWIFDEEHRVVFCDFNGLKYKDLTVIDLAFFGCLLECDHVTVVSDGLFDSDELDWDLWDLRSIQREIGNRIHHKFKRFVQHPENPAIYTETSEMLQGPITTFVDYATRHISGDTGEEATVEFNGLTAVSIDVKRDALYMIDFDLPRILPRNYDDFMENFKMHEVLPGGKWCMMNCLPKSARPFMGPNMYITPGGAYTHLHQDGNGTVDSGHCVLSGYNEVVILRRLPERHKAEACRLLPNRGNYDALYTFPHEGGKKPDWPTNETIESWRRMGYCPSVLILKPGQHMHINKGRLHAFRKMTVEPLPDYDCHCTLRRDLLKACNIQKTPLCVSIAWDWQFIGINPESINREITSALECQLLIDKRSEMKCLAIPKACLLAIGQSCRSLELDSEFQMIPRKKNKSTERTCVLTRKEMIRGIAPSLIYVLEQNISFIQTALRKSDRKLKIAPLNDTALNPLTSTVDPDGNDYFCKLCNRELENVYLHCDGCEELLQKDFNICMDCHEQGHWRKTVDMVGLGLGAPMYHTSSINHTGGFCSRGCCSCSHGRKCHICQRCNACSCTCHDSFTVRRRFYDLKQLQDIVGWLQSLTIEVLEHGYLTTPRLLVAADRGGRGYNAMRQLIKTHPELFPRNTQQDLRIEEEAVAVATTETPSVTSETDSYPRCPSKPLICAFECEEVTVPTNLVGQKHEDKPKEKRGREKPIPRESGCFDPTTGLDEQQFKRQKGTDSVSLSVGVIHSDCETHSFHSAVAELATLPSGDSTATETHVNGENGVVKTISTGINSQGLALPSRQNPGTRCSRTESPHWMEDV